MFKIFSVILINRGINLNCLTEARSGEFATLGEGGDLSRFRTVPLSNGAFLPDDSQWESSTLPTAEWVGRRAVDREMVRFSNTDCRIVEKINTTALDFAPLELLDNGAFCPTTSSTCTNKRRSLLKAEKTPTKGTLLIRWQAMLKRVLFARILPFSTMPSRTPGSPVR